MKKLLHLMQNILELFWSITFSPLSGLPFLKNYPPYNKVVSTAETNMNTVRQYLRKTIEKHQETFDSNNIRDVIDAFLNDNEQIDITYMILFFLKF